MKKVVISLLVLISLNVFSQEDLVNAFKKISDRELSNGDSYRNLYSLCKEVGNRLSGSPQAAKAVDWAYKLMKSYNLDTVYLQECMVPHWVRGEKEEAILSVNGKKTSLNILALGGSVCTPANGLTKEMIEFNSIDDLKAADRKQVEGKIVFLNQRFDASRVFVFQAYGSAVNARWAGAAEASKLGAAAVVVRSMTNAIDEFPHTGVMTYKDAAAKIPAVAISTKDAELLSAELKKGKENRILFYFKTNCMLLPDEKSYNVIGELRGSEKPEEIITVGGHLDSWDVGEGAHDDGAGCVQSVEVLKLYKDLGIKPKKTIRAVLFMNEENGGAGGDQYLAQAKLKGEKHFFALESDAGGFSPRGFTFECKEDFRKKIKEYSPLFLPYGLYDFDRNGAGADINDLKELGTPLGELSPDSQRYFDFHHTNNDVFENVHKRELELGAAAMTMLIYLIDQKF